MPLWSGIFCSNSNQKQSGLEKYTAGVIVCYKVKWVILLQRNKLEATIDSASCRVAFNLHAMKIRNFIFDVFSSHILKAGPRK